MYKQALQLSSAGACSPDPIHIVTLLSLVCIQQGGIRGDFAGSGSSLQLQEKECHHTLGFCCVPSCTLTKTGKRGLSKKLLVTKSYPLIGSRGFGKSDDWLCVWA